jgi:hypothetical protein
MGMEEHSQHSLPVEEGPAPARFWDKYWRVGFLLAGLTLAMPGLLALVLTTNHPRYDWIVVTANLALTIGMAFAGVTSVLMFAQSIPRIARGVRAIWLTRRRWFQFRLRTLLVLVTVVCLSAFVVQKIYLEPKWKARQRYEAQCAELRAVQVSLNEAISQHQFDKAFALTHPDTRDNWYMRRLWTVDSFGDLLLTHGPSPTVSSPQNMMVWADGSSDHAKVYIYWTDPNPKPSAYRHHSAWYEWSKVDGHWLLWDVNISSQP